MHFLYLHGFASGPDSTKARYFADAFARRGLDLRRLDLNVGAFAGLTVTGQIEVVTETINDLARVPAPRTRGLSGPGTQEGITLIGSSLGAYVSLLAAQADSRISRLVLLAPAIGFDGMVRKRVGIRGMSQWKREGTMPIEHYQWGRTVPVHYQLYTDAAAHGKTPLDRILPVQIFHGVRDETVPWQGSAAIVERNPLSHLVLLPSDHGLNDCLGLIEKEMFAWLDLP